jgi:large subunit ribosomal protein L21
MYAIVETGGKQYRVKPGDTVAVERLAGEPGETLDLERVLLVAGAGDGEARVGSPGVAGAVVRAEVVEHMRGEKIIVFRYKSKVRYRRKTGHRQSLTRLRITDILLDGASTVAAVEERVSVAPAEPGLAPEASEVSDIVETTPTPARRRRAAPAAEAAQEAGVTEPEATEPEVTEPEATEPEAAATPDSEDSPQPGSAHSAGAN